MRTQSLWMWNCEDLDTISRTMTHPSSLVPSQRVKSYREKGIRWLLFTRTPDQLQGPHVSSRLTGPAWDACDELEPEDVATADGGNMILDTLAEAFQGEYDVSGSLTFYVSQAKEALVKWRWRPWNRKATLIGKKPMSRRYCWPTKNHDSCGESNG